MKQSKTGDYAYLAGMVDGDGTIGIFLNKSPSRISGGRTMSCGLQLMVIQKDGKVIDWLKGKWGGTIWKRKTGNICYHWIIQNRKAYELIKRMKPFLKVKERQAEIAMSFQQRLNKGMINKSGQYMSLTEREIGERKKLKLELQKLNHNYRESKIHKEMQLQRLSEVNLPKEDMR